VDRSAVLAAYDEQVRRRPQLGPRGGVVEREEGLVRAISLDGWHGVSWSALDAARAPAVIAAQVERFSAEGRAWEWKHYSHDRPAELPALLLAAGLRAGEPEALMVAEIRGLPPAEPLPAGVSVEEVRDEEGVRALVEVHDAVFGGEHTEIGRLLLAALRAGDRSVVGVLARAGGEPVAAGRVEICTGTEFAGIWGGGTLRQWRGRGLFRALVARRAQVAAAAGSRYLQVDALPSSAPILERLGFHRLAVTTPYVHPGGAEPAAAAPGQPG